MSGCSNETAGRADFSSSYCKKFPGFTVNFESRIIDFGINFPLLYFRSHVESLVYFDELMR